MPKKQKDTNEILTDSFIRLVAQEAGFTIGDIKHVWKAVRRVIARILISGKVLNLAGFAKIYIKDIPSHEAWDQVHKVRYQREPSKRITMKVASTYKNLLDEYGNDKDETEENVE